MSLWREKFSFLLGPVFKDADERRFCRRWMFEQAYALVKIGYTVALPMNILALVLFPLFTNESVRPFFNAVHGGYLVLLIVAGIFYRNKPVFVFVLSLFTILFVVSYSYGMHMVWQLKEADEFMISHRTLRVSLGVAALGMFSLQLLPLGGRWGAVCTLAYSAAAFAALAHEGKNGVVVASIMMFLFIFSLMMRQRLRYTSIREAQAEYQTRVKIAPAHILRKSLESSSDIDTFFAPKRKFCACISSDWRSYQQLSSSLTPVQLAEALSKYYDECEVILRRSFPEGNYFSDWIADELFVVAYASSTMDEEKLADAAVSFSKKLITFKQGFYQEFQFPAAIDVGVSVGHALLGMMGPKSYRKATALGRVPGEARRLQTIGKELRERYAPRDRIVFNKAVYAQLQKCDEYIGHVHATEITNARDLEDHEFYFIDPLEEQKIDEAA